MLHLLSPPRVTLFPATRQRVARGSSASLLVHALLLAAASIAPVGTRAALPDSSATRLAIVQVSPLAAASPAPDLRRREPATPFKDAPNDTPPATIPLTVRNYVTDQDFTLDLARIRQRRNDLFPFVTWDLRFLDDRLASDRAGGIAYPSRYLPAAGTNDRALTLSAGALQALVDRAWSRQQRWTNLDELVKLADRHDGNRGDLARAFRAYLQQNIPQPYETHGFADPLFWIVLTLASDDAPMVEYATRYIRAHPSSRVTTELLFLMDESAESSCDVLARVLTVGSPELTLDATRRSSLDAYNLAVSLSVAYRTWLNQFHVEPAERCTAARTTILRRIIDTSPDGYGAADARVRLGTMLWAAGRQGEAEAWWRGIGDDERGVFDRVGRELRNAVDEGAVENNPGRIRRILLDQEYRWREAADDRLEYFGWSADRF
jgi:hypothetical protein